MTKIILVRLFLTILFTAPVTTLLLAVGPHSNPIEANLFPPDFLLQHRSEIGLTDEQLALIHRQTQSVAAATEQQQAMLKTANDALATLLATEEVDQRAALKQLDSIFKIEQNVRRSHLTLMIQLRNLLTAEQRLAVTKLRQTSQVKNKFAINDPRRSREKRTVAGQPVRTRDEIRKQIELLNKEDVAWRKIDWKTCLIDGINASRDQKKPIMLWVFIDRPIDDERC